jgi:integrase
LHELAGERIDYVVGYELALFCGMRRSEILALKESDINITFKTVSITKSRHRVKDKDIVKATKTEKSNRNIAVPDFVIEDINRLLETHRSFKYQHTDYLLQDGFGKPMTPSALTQQIYRIEDKAGLPHVSLHDLRHTFASMLNSVHVDIAMISRELGHSNINTTFGLYTHVFGNVAESSRGIANTLNSAFEKARESATFLPLAEKEKTAEA